MLIPLVNLNNIDDLDLTDYCWLYKINLNCFKLLYNSCIENVIFINNFLKLSYTSFNTMDEKSDLDINRGDSLG